MTEQLLVFQEALYQPAEDELVALARELGGYGADGTLTVLAGGCHTLVYVYETSEAKLVVRCPKDRIGAQALEADYDLLQELGGGRTPRALGLADVKGTPVAFVEFIEGIHKKDFNALTDDEIGELAQAMADFHAKTSERFSGASGAAPEYAGTHADYLWAMVQESVTNRLQMYGGDFSGFPEAPRLFEAGLRRLERILALHPEDFSGTTFVRLHHDLNPGNVIWKPDGSAVFIDANPTYGDPCDDVNYAVSNNDGSPEFQKRILQAYAAVAPHGAISEARMEAYTLKNWLDDLAWTIEMCEKNKNDQKQRETYEAAYATRLVALRSLLGENG